MKGDVMRISSSAYLLAMFFAMNPCLAAYQPVIANAIAPSAVLPQGSGTPATCDMRTLARSDRGEGRGGGGDGGG